MDDKEATGVVTVCFGILTLLASWAAEYIGIGNAAGYQDYRMAGVVLGAIIVMVGLLVTLKDQ
jgi:tetrahydromethanopterin S-methyltransferase subunit E